MQLARPTLLADSIELLANARVTNGAGGGSASWQTVKTVQGRGYALRNRGSEQMQAGKQVDPDELEFALDALDIDSSYRLRVKGRTYEIVSIITADPVTILRARRVS